MESEDLIIDGECPELTGQQLQEMLCSEIWYKGELTDPANVIHILVANQWHRLYFDLGMIFWRKDDEAPKSYGMPEYDSDCRVVDVAEKYDLKMKEIRLVESRPIPEGSEVAFTFNDGKQIIFSDRSDVTSYRT